MLPIIANRKIWYLLSGSLALISVLGLLIFGVRPGIDFTGGSLLEISYSLDRPESSAVNDVLKEQGVDTVQIQAVGEKGYLLRFSNVEEDKHRAIVAALRESVGDTGQGATVQTQNVGGLGSVQLGLDTANQTSQNQLREERFESIGPVIGQELKQKSVEAIIVVLLAILIYVAWAFRKVAWPVQSWKYGLVALVTLFHDVFIMFGVYTILSHIYGWELNTAFIAAILTVLGYSVNDTIVIFDRIRENLLKQGGAFEETVNQSVNQTFSRSLITSLTTLLVLIAVLIVGGTSIQSFVAALTIGVVVGTYSSIFIASPMLVSIQQRGQKARK